MKKQTKGVNISDELKEEIKNRWTYESGFRDGFKEGKDLKEKEFKRFIIVIKNKVLCNWGGQNEFVDYIDKLAGDKLT